MGKLESNIRKVKLRTKFAVLMVTLFAIALAVNVVWTTEAQRQQTENELQEKGLVLSQQMTAMWDFMSANQEKLEAAAYGSTGSYQGLHCAVVGRSIGRLFSIESGYTTRFVNFDPRNSEDEPDEFETEGARRALRRPNAYVLCEHHAVRWIAGVPVHGAHGNQEELPGMPWRASR